MQVLIMLLILLAINLVLLLSYLAVVKGGFIRRHLYHVTIDDIQETQDDEGSIIELRTGIFRTRLASLYLPSIRFDAIPDAATALRVAVSIMSGIKPEKQHTPNLITYDKKDGVWVVSFTENSDMQASGNIINLALREKDGKVLGTLNGW